MSEEREVKRGKMIMKIQLDQKQVYAGIRDFALKKRKHIKRIQDIMEGKEKVWFEVILNDSRSPKGLKNEKVDAIVEIFEQEFVDGEDKS